MSTIIIKTENKERIKLIRLFLEAIGVNFQVEESPYNEAYIAKIQKAEQDMKEGKGTKVDINNLWK